MDQTGSESDSVLVMSKLKLLVKQKSYIIVLLWLHSATSPCDNAWRRHFPSIIEAVVLIRRSKSSEERMSYYARKQLSDMKLSEHPHTNPSRRFLTCNETRSERKVTETAVNWLIYCLFFVYLTTLSLILRLRQSR